MPLKNQLKIHLTSTAVNEEERHISILYVSLEFGVKRIYAAFVPVKSTLVSVTVSLSIPPSFTVMILPSHSASLLLFLTL